MADLPDNPMKGQIINYNGQLYKFKGGDKTDPTSWEPTKAGTTMGESMSQELADKGPVTRALAGALGAFDKAAYGIKSLFSNLSPDEQQRVDAAKGTTDTAAGKVGSVATNLAISTPLFKAVPAIEGLAATPLGRDAMALLAAGGVGAGYGAATNPGERGRGAVAGGLGAMTGQAIGTMARGPFSPIGGSAADALQRQGVPITIGQSQGWQGLEDSLRAGSRSVGKRQAEAIEQWSQNQVNKTMPSSGTSVTGQPIPAKVGGTGRDAIQEGADAFDNAYGNTYGKMGTVQADAPLSAGLQGVKAQYSPLLIKSDAEMLSQQADRATAEFQSGNLNGRAVKDLINSYNAPAQQAFNDGNKRLGDAYRAIQDEIRNTVARQFPEVSQELKAIDSKYSEFLRVQRAAGKQGAADGVFSPEQLMQSIRELDKSPDKRAFARGNTVPSLLESAQQGKDVLGSRLPPVGPGTAEKLLPSLVSQNLAAALPGVLSFGAYRPSVQNFLTGRLAGQAGIDPEWMAALTSNGFQAMRKEKK